MCENSSGKVWNRGEIWLLYVSVSMFFLSVSGTFLWFHSSFFSRWLEWTSSQDHHQGLFIFIFIWFSCFSGWKYICSWCVCVWVFLILIAPQDGCVYQCARLWARLAGHPCPSALLTICTSSVDRKRSWLVLVWVCLFSCRLWALFFASLCFWYPKLTTNLGQLWREEETVLFLWLLSSRNDAAAGAGSMCGW